MDINKIIFESMLTEAAEQIRTKIAKNQVATVQEAIDQVIAELSLTNEEAAEVRARNAALQERAKKASKKLVGDEPVSEFVEEPVEAPAEAPAAEPTAICGNTMHFGSEDELDSAAGMLMYKGVPWKSKSKSNGEFLVEFDDADALQEAMDVLKRKFDFVEHGQRRVGVVEFDNLADYGKVMEFMKKQGMMIECREMGALDEDIELQEKMIAELEGQVIPSRAFAAKPKGMAGADFNVVEDQAARAVVVRKRWK